MVNVCSAQNQQLLSPCLSICKHTRREETWLMWCFNDIPLHNTIQTNHHSTIGFTWCSSEAYALLTERPSVMTSTSKALIACQCCVTDWSASLYGRQQSTIFSSQMLSLWLPLPGGYWPLFPAQCTAFCSLTLLHTMYTKGDYSIRTSHLPALIYSTNQKWSPQGPCLFKSQRMIKH